MFIGHFTEQPWQDDNTGLMGNQSLDLGISNELYNPATGAKLYNRYIDEKIYAEEMGFDGLMLNEHHSTPFCMQGVTNVGASILARVTKRAKIVILGNILPIWEDPLWLAEQLSMIDMISYGRLVSGFVRGGGARASPTMRRRTTTGSGLKKRTILLSRRGRNRGRFAGRASTTITGTSIRGAGPTNNRIRKSGFRQR